MGPERPRGLRVDLGGLPITLEGLTPAGFAGALTRVLAAVSLP